MNGGEGWEGKRVDERKPANEWMKDWPIGGDENSVFAFSVKLLIQLLPRFNWTTMMTVGDWTASVSSQSLSPLSSWLHLVDNLIAAIYRHSALIEWISWSAPLLRRRRPISSFWCASSSVKERAFHSLNGPMIFMTRLLNGFTCAFAHQGAIHLKPDKGSLSSFLCWCCGCNWRLIVKPFHIYFPRHDSQFNWSAGDFTAWWCCVHRNTPICPPAKRSCSCCSLPSPSPKAVIVSHSAAAALGLQWKGFLYWFLSHSFSPFVWNAKGTSACSLGLPFERE